MIFPTNGAAPILQLELTEAEMEVLRSHRLVTAETLLGAAENELLPADVQVGTAQAYAPAEPTPEEGS